MEEIEEEKQHEVNDLNSSLGSLRKINKRISDKALIREKSLGHLPLEQMSAEVNESEFSENKYGPAQPLVFFKNEQNATKNRVISGNAQINLFEFQSNEFSANPGGGIIDSLIDKNMKTNNNENSLDLLNIKRETTVQIQKKNHYQNNLNLEIM